MPEIPIPAIIIIVLTALLGIIYHVFAKIRDEKNNFLRLSEDFIKPFVDAKSIIGISTRGLHESCTPREIFIKLYSDQRRNVESITPYLPRRQRKRLCKAWSEYEKNINNDSPSSWFDSNNIYKESDEIKEKRKICIAQLDRIMFFFDYHNMFSILKLLQRIKS